MGGKAIILVLIGFSMIFLVMERNMSSASTRAVENMVDYYTNINAHNIAVSGANLAANQIFLNPSWTAGYQNVSFSKGKFSASVQVIDAFQNIRRITSVSNFNGYIDTVQITLQPSKFSKFGYYSANEGGNIWWVSGDTVWGPFHSQDQIKISGNPVFNGKVSTKIKPVITGYSNPEFNGGLDVGVDLPIPPFAMNDLETAAENGGYNFDGDEDTLYLTFAGDSLKYRFNYKDQPTTVYTKDFAPNGVIFASGATIRLQGTVGGNVTVGSSTTTTAITKGKGKKKKTTYVETGGNIYLDDDIVYKNDHNSNPNATDMLGIVAEQNVFVTDNNANSKDIHIQAAIFAQKGGFGAENYASRPPSGSIVLNGGITQNTRLAVGTFNWSGKIVSGFSKSYHYDNRLMISSPPFFPNTGSLEIVSWYE